ncbi:MAG: uroporphyrinogen-III C-methyltransferase [Proteobacteria bacterium]|nr:uroporphyrinogen-III C-methyltransferase [Pseudomonadota bacterium]
MTDPHEDKTRPQAPQTTPIDSDPSDIEPPLLELEEAAQDADPPVEPKAKPVKTKRPGRALAAWALLISLAAAGGVGYIYYELIQSSPVEDIQAQLKLAREERSSVRTRLSTLDQQQKEALEALERDQNRRLNDLERSLVASLGEVVNQGPPSEREWKLAEVEYLLRIANHRVLMERDAPTARDLLGAADGILNELDDFSLHQVRARLADEIVALSLVPDGDIQGIYLQLEAIKGMLRALKEKRPAYLSETVAPQAADQPWQEVLIRELKSLFQLNRLSDGVKPLLTPDESTYLELNLRLKLEQAQLAALKGDQIVFNESIEGAVDMMLDYFDQHDESVLTAVTQLQEVGTFEVAAPLPDIAGSLRALLQVRRGGQ